MTAEGATEMRVRRMVAADLKRVMQIASGVKDAPQWSEAVYAAALEWGGVPPRITLAAEGADGLEGFAVASLVGTQAELETIVVSGERQRQGVGTRLVEALAAELRVAGAEELFLEVRASNQRALGFYRGMGFAETSRRARYYADPMEDAVLMRLPLA